MLLAMGLGQCADLQAKESILRMPVQPLASAVIFWHNTLLEMSKSHNRSLGGEFIQESMVAEKGVHPH